MLENMEVLNTYTLCGLWLLLVVRSGKYTLEMYISISGCFNLVFFRQPVSESEDSGPMDRGSYCDELGAQSLILEFPVNYGAGRMCWAGWYLSAELTGLL